MKVFISDGKTGRKKGLDVVTVQSEISDPRS